MRRVLVWLPLVCSLACGGKEAPQNSPTSPSPPQSQPTVSSLTIGGATSFRTGQSRTFSAEAQMSNGSSQPAANVAWSSSNESIATIDASGLVTALAHGSATIAAASQGQTAQVPVRVWQNYQGRWTGTYVIRVCTNTGWFAERPAWCSIFPRGSRLGFVLTLTQNDGAASGTLQLGNLVGAMSGGIFDNGRFVGTGTPKLVIDGVEFTSHVGTFSVLAKGETLSGNLVVNTTAAGLSGNGYWEADLENVTRSLDGVDTRAFDAAMHELMAGKR